MWAGPECRPRIYRADRPSAPPARRFPAGSRKVCVSDRQTKTSACRISGLVLRDPRWKDAQDAHTPPPTAGGARPAACCMSGSSSRRRPRGRRAPGMQRGWRSAASEPGGRSVTCGVWTEKQGWNSLRYHSCLGNLMQLTPCCTHNPYGVHDVHTHDCCLPVLLEIQKRPGVGYTSTSKIWQEWLCLLLVLL